MPFTPQDCAWMERAMLLAARGQGSVEPNPLVGCVIARGDELLAEGWHRRYGGPHAEIEALGSLRGQLGGATLYVTLEPCCHLGQTPPCTDTLIRAGVERVVAARLDPFPQVSGRGVEHLRAAGVHVEVGLLEDESRALNAPYEKLILRRRPWIIAKWAMTLDGKLASRAGASRWISGERSRAVGHALRGRVDAVLVGRGTAEADDPLLTARPAGPRTAVRIVLDSRARLASASQLVQSARETPVLVAAGPPAADEDRRRLEQAGCEVLRLPGDSPAERLEALLDELGRRRWTNLLVEGGGATLGAFFDADEIDEVHVFTAPKLVGGAAAPSPLGGLGRELMADAALVGEARVELIDGDVYFRGRLA